VIRAATADDPLRVAVLVSGSGTNLQALIDRFGHATSGVRIVAVASTRDGVRALERAAAAGVEHAVFARGDDPTGRDERLATWLAERGVELLVLAGWMAVLGPALLDRFRAVNVHPSLLPAFPGSDAVGDALRAGVRVTGVTVHLADAGVDSGPILLQAAVPVHYHETREALLARLHVVEHRLLPEAVGLLASDRVRLDGAIAHVTGSEGS
jgi:phosphoribosylglycinamide formyltransferase-1